MTQVVFFTATDNDCNRYTSCWRKPHIYDIHGPTKSLHMATFHGDLAKPKSLCYSQEECRSQHGLLASPVPQVNRIIHPNLPFTQPLKQLIHFSKAISKLRWFTRSHISSMCLLNPCSTSGLWHTFVHNLKMMCI
jgi:hypothetical protein